MKQYNTNEREQKLLDHYFVNGQPDRFDFIIEKMIPFMVSDKENWLENFKEAYADDEDILNDYNDIMKRIDRHDKEYFKKRLMEKYEQYLYCFFPEMYDEYELKKEQKETEQMKSALMYEQNKKYNNRNYTFFG